MIHSQIVAAVTALAALLCAFLLVRRLRRARLVDDTPASRIRSAAQGYVRVGGRALPPGDKPTRAPLSGRECVWWDYNIAQREEDDEGTQWVTQESATSVELFVLEDEESRCLVGPVQAEVTPTNTRVWYGSTSRPNAALASVLPSAQEDWRYTERLIDVGARLSVLGELRSHSETGDVAAATTATLREWKRDQEGLLRRFDTNHDGHIDAAEWQAARDSAAREARAQTLSASISRVSVISLPSNGEPFLIAPLSALQLRNRERLTALAYLLLGLISIFTCAWALRS